MAFPKASSPVIAYYSISFTSDMFSTVVSASSDSNILNTSMPIAGALQEGDLSSFSVKYSGDTKGKGGFFWIATGI